MMDEDERMMALAIAQSYSHNMETMVAVIGQLMEMEDEVELCTRIIELGRDEIQAGDDEEAKVLFDQQAKVLAWIKQGRDLGFEIIGEDLAGDLESWLNGRGSGQD